MTEAVSDGSLLSVACLSRGKIESKSGRSALLVISSLPVSRWRPPKAWKSLSRYRAGSSLSPMVRLEYKGDG